MTDKKNYERANTEKKNKKQEWNWYSNEKGLPEIGDSEFWEWNESTDLIGVLPA